MIRPAACGAGPVAPAAWVSASPPAPKAIDRMPTANSDGRPAPKMRPATRTFQAPSKVSAKVCIRGAFLSRRRGGGGALDGLERRFPLVVDVVVVHRRPARP